MTRINVMPVDELTDNFILAEYFELPRVFNLVSVHRRKNRVPAQLAIPPAYTFGEGHAKFFYDKLAWLHRRHQALGVEGAGRGLALRIDPAVGRFDPLWFQGTPWWGEYEPTPEAIQLNWDRLQERRRYDGGIYQGSR